MSCDIRDIMVRVAKLFPGFVNKTRSASNAKLVVEVNQDGITIVLEALSGEYACRRYIDSNQLFFYKPQPTVLGEDIGSEIMRSIRMFHSIMAERKDDV